MRSEGLAVVQLMPLPVSQSEAARSDDELMGLAARGERQAYADLVRRHERRLRAFCARWCGSTALGEEIAQECFVQLWQQRRRYVAKGKLRSYLFHLAANRCKNEKRAQRREQDRMAPVDEHDVERISERLLIRQRSERLQRGLERLPDAQREAVLLRYSAELDYAEIASLVGAPEPTVRSRVFQGLIKLRRLLRGEQGR